MTSMASYLYEYKKKGEEKPHLFLKVIY